MTKEVEKLQELIDNHDNIVFFGGAGVSTESGIPDFRSQNGLYNMEYEYSRKDRVGCCRIYPCRGKRQTDPYKKFVESFTFCKNQAY